MPIAVEIVLENDRLIRVLMLHNRYQVHGGEDVSTESECRILREAGHHVDLLTADNHDIESSIAVASAAIGAIWSRYWYHLVKRKLESDRYDVLHIQNFFPLISPSVYYAAHAAGVPVVQAIRNYRLACPSANLFRDNQVCSQCVGRRMKIPGIIHRCYRGSALGSALVGTVSGLHMAAGTWHRKGTYFVAVSQYVSDVISREGLPSDRIFLKPCFSFPPDPGSFCTDNERKHVLFVGRLAPEKGIDLLLEAWAKIESKVPLNIVGEGMVPSPLPDNVQVLGKMDLDEVYAMMRSAVCVVIPGGWPEPFGRVAVEAFAHGTPVIASDIGGVAEIVEPGVNGDLFVSGDATDLAGRLDRLIHDDGMQRAYGDGALTTYNARYTPTKNLEILEKIYATAIKEV